MTSLSSLKVLLHFKFKMGMASAGIFANQMSTPTLSIRDESATSHRSLYCLLPPRLERGDGTGPAIDLGPNPPSLLIIMMGINHVLENEKLIVSIWGSADGEEWGDRPLVTFPPKYYCGVYSTFLNLAENRRVRYLRPSWQMLKCNKNYGTPMFGFYLSAAESGTMQAA